VALYKVEGHNKKFFRRLAPDRCPHYSSRRHCQRCLSIDG